MKGNLYIIFGDNIEETYWSLDCNLYKKIKDSYQDYLKNCIDEKSFEEWFNYNHVSQIERVFLKEIYI